MHRAVLFSTPGWVLPGASADIDFTHNRAWVGGSTSLASLLSTSRASPGMAQNASGSWVSFAANAPRISDQGLLTEQAATNLFLNSAAPATQTITLSATGSYTLTCWGASGSATVAAGTAAGTGFGTATASVRGGQVTFAITAAGTITVTISGSPLYVQVEAGAFGTSPIVTGGSSATRAADVITLTGAALKAALNAKAARTVTDQIPAFVTGAHNSMVIYGNSFNQVLGFASSTSVETYNGSTAAAATIGGAGDITSLVKSAFGFDGTSITAIANVGTKAIAESAFGTASSPVYIGTVGGELNGYLGRLTFGPAMGQFDSMTTGTSPS